MKGIPFVKMQGSGNDFIVVSRLSGYPAIRLKKLVQKLCDRKYGIGADGVLLIEKSRNADARMRIINADGSEAEMCGNGARCAALYVRQQGSGSQDQKKTKKFKLETKAGIVEAEVKGDNVKIKLTDPSDLRLDIPVAVGNEVYNVDFVNTGVPHAVIETDDLESVRVRELGRALRHHKVFAPSGTNVDFIKVEESHSLRIRTYERGVEDETLACGTGSAASAITAVLNYGTRGEAQARHRVAVKTRSGEILSVYFKVSKYNITDVWLEGRAQIVFSGVTHG